MTRLTIRQSVHAVITLIALLFALNSHAEAIADKVLVVKSEHALYLMKDGEAFATFHVVFGASPEGHKLQQGDQRTPEGNYTLGYKNSGSRYYKSIHISYPNTQDRAQAQARGVRPGGDIMIHGQPNGREWLTPVSQLINWTNGCIALTNKDMDVVWDAVQARTPIEIRP